MPKPSELKPGVLLISEPFLEDPSFNRAVILLCEHSSSHSFGLVLTQPQEVILDSIMDAKVMGELPLFAGGPVDPTILQFIHRRPDLIQGGQEITPGLFWAGDFEQAIEAVVDGTISFQEIKFFIGYSGWSAGQLDREIKSNAWIISDAVISDVFEVEPEKLWRKVLYQKGGNFRVLSTYPDDPRLN
ncbi:YqgE/AlgH family protein [Aquirufa sp.]|jgi:putative transcriptional regulator|uniref:YqgE/AlgH family protein n=1 Tax=Aquirufa sp. TaxID=2676249 RepID=UPI0037BEB7DF